MALCSPLDGRVLSVLMLGAVLSTPACSREQATPAPTPEGPTEEQIAACATGEIDDSLDTPEYWKPETFGRPDDGFVRRWYSLQLCAMGEAPLGVPVGPETRLRFLWLRSFHPATAVRVRHRDSNTHMIATQLTGRGGYEPGEVGSRTERQLTPQEWAEIERLTAQARFWTLETEAGLRGLDGAQWIVEVSEPGRYHVVDRWSGGELERIGRFLMQLSSFDPEPIY